MEELDAVMDRMGFTTEKWQTVQRTRTFLHSHPVSSVVPCLCAVVYAEAQCQKEHRKGLGVVMPVSIFNFVQHICVSMGEMRL